ncbi:MAG: hypothetical protein WBQ72_13450 [Terriglobales bacterium]|jgi:sugar lactone lactonase YvrE
MKSTKNFTRIAATLLCLLAFASASFAAKTNPLSYPSGLAVDAAGNLWVANNLDNNILVFGANYKQLPDETITQGINGPTGIAFDSFGNLWVADNRNNTVTEYTGGVQDTGATITNGISQPEAIAVDGLNNVWVANTFNADGGGYDTSFTVYAPGTVYGPGSNLLMTFGPYPTLLYGIVVSEGAFVYGDGNYLNLTPASVAIATGSVSGVNVGGNNTAVWVASAANGTIYFTTTDNAVNYAKPASLGSASQLFGLSFAPSGIAVDSVRGRIYISNGPGNVIEVYSTGGTLLKTIN